MSKNWELGACIAVLAVSASLLILIVPSMMNGSSAVPGWVVCILVGFAATAGAGGILTKRSLRSSRGRRARG